MKKHLSFILATLIFVLALTGCNTEKSGTQLPSSTENQSVTEKDSSISDTDIIFVTIPTNGEIASFEMGITEVTNTQYLNFLNAAYADGTITYNVETEKVYNADGNEMIWLGGSRVVKDHNKDGVYSLYEMENPLNRCFIEFNAEKDTFELVDPSLVDWAKYCDPTLYPHVVDSLDDWAELSENKDGFYAYGDDDKLMPTLEEIANWPVTFIRWYGAKEFAEFYGYDLPTIEQWKLAASGGAGFVYATSDGTLTPDNAWYNPEGPGVIHKGHVQPVDSLGPNPYGLYNLGGNAWEWTVEWYNPATNEYFIDENLTADTPISDEDMKNYENNQQNNLPSKEKTPNGTPPEGIKPPSQNDAQGIPPGGTPPNATIDNRYKKGLIGGSFNYFDRTLSLAWTHSAYPRAGNDHFTFRVVKNIN